jgi:protocatechuate 3,4-dioxygenase beta subunit
MKSYAPKITMLRTLPPLLISLSAFVLGATAQAQGGDKLQRVNTGVGYALCGSCTVPKDVSSEVTLVPKDEPGERMILSGRIYKEDGVTPASGVTLFLYQTDAGGYYHRPKEDVFAPRLRGWLRTGMDGRYEIRTVKPAPEVLASDEPAHIHVQIFGQGIPEYFLREFWFEGDPHIKSNEREQLSKLATYSPIIRLTKDKDGVSVGRRDIRLRPTGHWKYQND